MGRPPVPMADSTRIARARGVVRNAEAAEQAAAAADQSASPEKKLPKVVANTTDPQSRIMPTRRGFLQGYNAQVAVTGDQLIVAVRVEQSPNDQGSFTPMMRATQDAAARLHAVTGNADHIIGTVLADAGYNSDANLKADGPDRLIALGKGRDQARAAAEEPAHRPPPAGAYPSTRHRRRRTRRRRHGSSAQSAPAARTSPTPHHPRPRPTTRGRPCGRAGQPRSPRRTAGSRPARRERRACRRGLGLGRGRAHNPVTLMTAAGRGTPSPILSSRGTGSGSSRIPLPRSPSGS